MTKVGVGYCLVSWSGGKDAMMALHTIRSDEEKDIRLLTIIEQEQNAVNMHGVPLELIQKQAEALGLPIELIRLEKRASDDAYEAVVCDVMNQYKERNCQYVIYGDIFLEDLRAFKEKLTSLAGLSAVFPLWGRKTEELGAAFIHAGFRAIVTSVDSRALDSSFVGMDYDEKFLRALPYGVDPCGEKGEFHTFVYDGPGFHHPIEFNPYGIVLHDRRFYQLNIK